MPDTGGLFSRGGRTLVGMLHLPPMPGSPRHDGTSVLKNGVESVFGLASALGVQFVRIKVYVRAVVGSDGIVEGAAYAALTARRRLGLDQVAMLADVSDRTSRQVVDVAVPELANLGDPARQR